MKLYKLRGPHGRTVLTASALKAFWYRLGGWRVQRTRGQRIVS